MPLTQKAKGLAALKKYGNPYGFPTPAFTVHGKPDDIPEGEYFGRPCPLTPRHGFVESRKVSSRDEAIALFHEARAADSQAELVLMPLIKAETSAVWTRGQLVIGPGNDGATSGSKSITLPVTGELATPELLEAAGVKTSPYMEFVSDKQCTWLVQLRDGPSLGGNTSDFIPTPTKVRRIIVLPESESERPDLLAWEKMVKEFDTGTAVCHPGGALASHYAVHCIQRWVFDQVSIPVLTTRQPEIGEILEPVEDIPHDSKPDVRELQRGFCTALTLKIQKHSNAYYECGMVMLAGVHNAGVWMGRHDFLIGAGMGMAFRLTHMAAMGELRHKFMNYVASSKKPVGRGGIYNRFFNTTLGYRKKLPQSIKMFYSDVWSSSYGGPKWAEFSWMGVRLWNAVVRGDYTGALNTFNLLVNMAHNGGWAFNKFMAPSEMDRSAAAGAYPALHSMSLLYHILTGPCVKNMELEPLPEPVKISQQIERRPVQVQVTMTGDEVYLQVGWDKGERTKRRPIVVDKAAKKIIRAELKAELNTISSMGGSATQYVPLADMGNGIWGVGGTPVVVVEPVFDEVVEEIICPESMDDAPVVLEPVKKPAEPAKQWSDLTNSDSIIIQCGPPPAIMANPFAKSKFQDAFNKEAVGKALIFGAEKNKLSDMHAKAVGHPIHGAVKKSKTIQAGDLVKCGDPSHPHYNPFTVFKVVKIKGYKYAYEYWATTSKLVHSNGKMACSFKNLTKLQKENQ